MSFVVFTVAPPAPIGTGIGVSLRGGRGTNVGKGPAKMVIVVSFAVATELGWEKEPMLEVLLGTGTQHGLLRLCPAAKNCNQAVKVVFRGSMKRLRYFEIKLGVVPNFVSRHEKKQWVQWKRLEKKDGGGIEIILPAWAEETAPGNREKIAKPIVRDTKILSPAAARVRAEIDAQDASYPEGTLFYLRDDEGRYLHESGAGMAREKTYAWKGVEKQIAACRKAFVLARNLCKEAA